MKSKSFVDNRILNFKIAENEERKKKLKMKKAESKTHENEKRKVTHTHNDRNDVKTQALKPIDTIKSERVSVCAWAHTLPHTWNVEGRIALNE